VVGASLGGLLTALTLARSGFDVTVVERAAARRRTGGALVIGEGLVERVTGWDGGPHARAIPTALAGGGHMWETIHDSLRATGENEDRIVLLHDTRAIETGQDDDTAWVVTDGGETLVADLIVGADGHRSTMRRAVSPEQPDARFAGYVIWLGVVEEPDLPAGLRGDRGFDGGAFLGDGDDVMFGYAMPGRDRNDAGHRQIGWAWYDATHNDFLRTSGHVRGDVVHHSVLSEEIPEWLNHELAEMVASRWPSPWRDVMQFSLEHHTVTGTPIAEYIPTALVNGRIALIGDAAHVQTPMTGQGFGSALADAEALAAALTTSAVPQALAAYERERLSAVRALVQSGRRFSRSFARDYISHGTP